MLREIIEIDEEKCDGCGVCVPACAEGALQIIDGKARLISDLFCDGLGACIQECPQDAITIVKREAEPYDEIKVIENMIIAGENTMVAHLRHLHEHNEIELLSQALEFLSEKGISIEPEKIYSKKEKACACAGSPVVDFREIEETNEEGSRTSYLSHWPVQLHLLSPNAPQYKGSNLLLTADCVPFAYADYHKDFLKDKTLAIACPKLDSNQLVYMDKLTALIGSAGVQSITVMIMEVPCCSGLFRLAKAAVDYSGTNVPLNVIVIGIDGKVRKN